MAQRPGGGTLSGNAILMPLAHPGEARRDER